MQAEIVTRTASQIDPTHYPAVSSTQTFTYDGLSAQARAVVRVQKMNRLVGATQTGTNPWYQTFNYDAFGNRRLLTYDTNHLPAPSPEVVVTAGAYDSHNQVTSYTSSGDPGYDAAGNTLNFAGVRHATYDAENRQISVTPSNNELTTYAYDGQGRRIKKTTGSVTTTFVYDASGQLAAEYGGPTVTDGGTRYLFSDHLGSTRLVAKADGAEDKRYDFLPFGEELGASYPATSGSGVRGSQRMEFTSKERDAETGLDYFGARYMSSAQGRFTSVDPISGTVLHLLNPQRWNMYAYAVNNPLAYTDPDGRDAIAVKFGNLAHNLGHAGVVSVHHDGKGTFADFGPQHGGEAHDAGKYNFVDYKTQIKYGPDGKPTKDSLSALANELADNEGQPHDSVSVAYFKTSDAETAALDAYINAAKNQQAGGKTPTYWVGFRDCIWFCMNGMQKAGVGPGSSTLTIPNLQYLNFWLWADQTATGTNPPKENVTSKICYTDENGKQVCQWRP